MHDVWLEILGRRTEFLDGCPDLYVPLQFRCDFDRRKIQRPHPDAKSSPRPEE